MSNAAPTLHMLCGKIAAGKSTLAAELGDANGTVIIAEDEWLNAQKSHGVAHNLSAECRRFCCFGFSG